MSRRRPNINAHTLDDFLSDDFSATYEPNNKNLFKVHKVPKFKRRYVSNW